MSILFNNKQDCCGCTACMNICFKQAITMQPDEDGFLYPLINSELCVECGLCKTVCAYQNVKEQQFNSVSLQRPHTAKEPIATYAAIIKDKAALLNSSSGGASTALAQHSFEKGGVVFGCTLTMSEEKNGCGGITAEHICIDKFADIRKIQGSKYVQSNLKNTFAEAKQYLREGRQVLFTGTPCQIAGLKSYLAKDYDNLITVDLICHGVPSPSFFKGYIFWLEGELKARIVDFKFRDKMKGWGLIGKATYQKDNITSEKSIHPIDSYYYHYFLKGDTYRKCCYECPYAGSNRTGDITIGDYWGIEKVHPKINTKKGVSLVIVNSENGMRIIDKLNMNLTTSNFQQARAQNHQLKHPTPKSGKRDDILKLFHEKGFHVVADQYYSEMKVQIATYKVKTMILRPIKAIIKQLFISE